MSAGTSRQQPNQAATVEELSGLLEQVLEKSPHSVRVKGIENTLLKNIDRIKTSLPDYLKASAERLVRRATIYIQMSPKLDDATPASLMMCVIKAAEMGLPLDGRLCHAVVFNNKYKNRDDTEYWVQEATPMADYRGLVAVAKRTGLIEDIYADVICQGDQFNWHRTGDKDDMYHSYDLTVDRGPVIGTYCKVKPRGSDWRFEIMERKAIEEIRSKSKAKDHGPWKTPDSSDWKQMAKKTVLRRVLQLFSEDPGLALALDAEDREYTLDEAGIVPDMRETKVSRLVKSGALKGGHSQPIEEESGRRQVDEDPEQKPQPKKPKKAVGPSQMTSCVEWLKSQVGIAIDVSDPEKGTVLVSLPNNAELLLSERDMLVPDGKQLVVVTDPDAQQQCANILESSRKAKK